MSIIITNTQGRAVLAKDVNRSKHTREQLDHTISAAKSNPTRKAFTYLSMTDNTQQFVIVTIR